MYHLFESYTPEISNVMDTVAIDNDSVRAGFGRQLLNYFLVEDLCFNQNRNACLPNPRFLSLLGFSCLVYERLEPLDYRVCSNKHLCASVGITF